MHICLPVFFPIYAARSLTRLRGRFKGTRHLADLSHDLFPRLVHFKKHLGLSRKLPLDVLG